MESSNPSPSSLPTPATNSQPIGVLTAKPKPRPRPGRWSREMPNAPPRLQCQPMVLRPQQSFIQSVRGLRPHPPASLPRPSTFPLARPSLTERKVPSVRSGPAAIVGRSIIGRPNQGVRRNAVRAAIGWSGCCPPALAPSLRPWAVQRRGKWGRAQVAGLAARGLSRLR